MSDRLRGHTLTYGGKVFDRLGYRARVGRDQCSCGVRSPSLPSDAARLRWHREHKDEIRAQRRESG